MPKSKRSGHKKSTAGCANCKRRHLKCDETRPSCVNCTTQGRHCPYQDEHPSAATTLASGTSLMERPFAGQELLLSNTDDSHSPRSVVQLSLPRVSCKLVYVELLQQWLEHTHRTYAYDIEHARIYGSMTLDQALAFPFLMHAILANAALHLSVTRPEKATVYRQIVGELSSRALTEFNATLSELDEKSIIAAFLFSSITSTHQLCECFLSSMDDFDTFIQRFIECLKISRGVNIVIRGWWSFLQKTELGPILTTTDNLQAKVDIDQQTIEFDDIRQLINSLDGVNSIKTTEIYLSSIQVLQRCFNEHKALSSPELNRSLSRAFAWPINASPDLTALLETKRPEALLILAYYAPILHTRRFSWALGDAGASMFRLVEAALGPTWTRWLRWPKETVQSDGKADLVLHFQQKPFVELITIPRRRRESLVHQAARSKAHHQSTLAVFRLPLPAQQHPMAPITAPTSQAIIPTNATTIPALN